MSLSIQGGTYEINTIRGMAVDDSGILYIAGADLGGTPRIFRYNPSTQTVENQSTTSLNTPWDVVFKAPYVYAANYLPAGGSILQLGNNLSFTAELTTDPGASGPFHGPHRFLAILNREFYVIDEDAEDTLDTERIVSFDDFSDSWSTFDPGMISQPAFLFYSSC